MKINLNFWPKRRFIEVLKTFDLMFKLSTTKVLRFALWEGFWIEKICHSTDLHLTPNIPDILKITYFDSFGILT